MDNPVFDPKRLADVGPLDPDEIREVVHLYLEQSRRLLAGLQEAVQAGASEDVERLAHKWRGSSATCGMAALVPVLERLETHGREGSLDAARSTLEEAGIQFDRIGRYLDENPNVENLLSR